MTARIAWPMVLTEAAVIVNSYDTPVTLRQLFYRLVAAQLIPNTDTSYKTLSSRTAEARRAGTFPDLMDRGRLIHRASSWPSPQSALRSLIGQYRRDRTEGQETLLFIGVEKNGMVRQLEAWFGELGIPILALGGYSSQSYVDDVAGQVTADPRPAILLYAGDHDASGEDIDRDFVDRTGCWAKVIRVALSADQVDQYDLPPAPGKAADSRSAAFLARHGRLVQVELDALPPDVLRGLYDDALAQFWDQSAYASVIAREIEDVAVLEAVLA